MVEIPKASRQRVSARAAARKKSGAESKPDTTERRSLATPRSAGRRKKSAAGSTAASERTAATSRSAGSSNTPPEQRRAQRRSGDVVESLDLRSLSLADLHEVMSFCVQEIRERRLEDQDIDSIIDEAFQRCFTSEGIATMPAVINGFVAVPGSVATKNASGTKHECNLFTVRINDEDRWSWDFADVIVENRTFTDGDLRKSIALYPAIDGMLIFGHDRKKSQKSGSRWPVHTYRAGGVRSLRLVMDSETEGHFDVAPSIETRKLPMPSGIEEG